MATPIRTQILNAINTIFATITTVNGYNNTLKRYSNEFFTYEELAPDEFPACCIAIGPSPYTPMTNLKYTSGGSIQGLDGWALSTIGYIKVDTQESLGSTMELMIQDLLKAFLADTHIGIPIIVQNMTLVNINPYLDLEENIGVVEVVWNIKYDFANTAP